MPLVEKLNVMVDLEGSSLHVGVLAMDGPNLYFEYSDEFQKSGLEISPFHLSAKRKLYKNPGRRKSFHGLPGVFVDSLAEGWGSELMAREHSEQTQRLTILQRLATIGDRGMGALRYEPEDMQPAPDKSGPIDLSAIARSAVAFAKNKNCKLDEQLLFAGRYIGGSTPKALVTIDPSLHKIFHGVYPSLDDHELYIIKFHVHRMHDKNHGALEYLYSMLARDAEIDMPETKLVEIDGERFFAVKRFDRNGKQKLHTHSLVNLMETPADAQVPYEAFFKTTMFLTRDMSQVVEAYKRMSFNVALHNRDDHPGNHMFLMNAKGEWRLSPAFDLMYAKTPGQHLGMKINSKQVYNLDDMIKIGVSNGINARKCKTIQQQIMDAVARFPKLARKLDIDQETTGIVNDSISQYYGKQVVR